MEENQTLPQETTIPTPEQVEQELLNRELKSLENPMEVYAKHFQVYSPILSHRLENLGNKALIRLVKLLVTFPLENGHLKPLDNNEKEIFNMADELLKSKYSMVIFAAFESMEKEKELARMQKGAADAANGVVSE